MGRLGEVIDEPVSGPADSGPVRRSIWPSMHPRLLELVDEHRSTIVFVNARRLAERLATRLNELALDEAQGVCGNPPGPGWDWNGDGDAIDVNLQWDINTDNGGSGDGAFSLLRDFDDWANLVFSAVVDADGMRLGNELMTCQAVPGG